LSMSNRLAEIFDDHELVGKIQRKLPYLFRLAESESSRAGKVGMQVGSLRERILVAMLIYKFGEENVRSEIPITQPEVDAEVYGTPISIKTITGGTFSGVKLVWTVDPEKAREFFDRYMPCCDILLVQIKWGDVGSFCWIPLSVQRDQFTRMGRKGYLKLPRQGTNPRGVEFAKEAMSAMVVSEKTRRIAIRWDVVQPEYDAYQRWIEYWRSD